MKAAARLLNSLSARIAARSAPIGRQQAKGSPAQAAVQPSSSLSAGTAARPVRIGWQKVKASPASVAVAPQAAARSAPIGQRQAKTLPVQKAVEVLNSLAAGTVAHLALIGQQQTEAPPAHGIAAPPDLLLAQTVVRSPLIDQQQEEAVASSPSVPPLVIRFQTERRRSGFRRGRCRNRRPWLCGRRQSRTCNPEHRRTESSHPRGWSGGPENAGASWCHSDRRPCIWTRARARHLASPIARPSR